jgi:hypothetical protein
MVKEKGFQIIRFWLWMRVSADGNWGIDEEGYWGG